MPSPTIQLSDSQLDQLLAQDAPLGDLTTEALGIADRPGRISFALRADGVVCGAEEAARLFRLAGAEAEALHRSGARLDAGTLVLTGHGPAGALHRAWKVAQTLMEYAGGIASRTRRIVEAARAEAPDIAIACTRKNFPGAKEISVKAVLAGGAQMHRLGLSETLLVFPEHRAFLASDAGFLELRRRHPEKKLVVETAFPDEALAFARAGVDVLQLEKLSPEAVRQVVLAVRSLPAPPVVAAAGGVTEANAAAYAATGCDVLVTSAPYAAPPADIKVVMAAAGTAGEVR